MNCSPANPQSNLIHVHNPLQDMTGELTLEIVQVALEAFKVAFEAMKDCCERGFTVQVKELYPVAGIISQYYLLHPNQKNPLAEDYGFFLKVNGSKKVVNIPWIRVHDLYFEEGPSQKDPTKKVVAAALLCPQPEGACSKLLETLTEQKRPFSEILETLDDDFAQLLGCRLIRELVALNKIPEAENIYSSLVDKTFGDYNWQVYDLSMAVMCLIQAGSQLPNQKTLDFLFHFHLTDDTLNALVEETEITQADAEKAKILREDPKILQYKV